MNKIKPVALATCVLIAGVVLAISIKGISRKPIKPEIVFFGDSRVGNDRTDTALPVLLEKATGMTTLNAGIGGSGLAALGIDETWDRYSMVALSQAVLHDDFSAITAGNPDRYLEYNEIVDYVPDTVDKISKTDFKNVKYIIIEQGTNDYLSGVPLYNEADPYDVHTVEGALRTSIDNLRKAAPGAEIVLISPCFTFTIEGYGDELDLSFGTEEDYADFEKELALETGVLFVDFYHDSGIDRDNWKDYLFDGLHMNDRGNEVLISLLTDKLKHD